MYEYDRVAKRSSGGNSVKWSALGLGGRQGVVAVFALILAKILGPEAYGIVAQATIYMTLTAMLLDQGIAAALVRAGRVTQQVVGAAAGLNLLLSVLLAGITLFLAPFVGDFFGTPELESVLVVLGVGLPLKAAAIVPRMLLTRAFDFRRIAVADAMGAFVGGVGGLLTAGGGGGYWSLVAQILIMDLVTAVMLTHAARPPYPNWRFKLTRPLLGFSSQVFGSNLLNYTASNLDSILIGRYLGVTELAHYDIAYRVLRTPVQITGQVLNRVLFPAVSRAASLGLPVHQLVIRSIRTTAVFMFPLMALVGVSANELVPVILGNDWVEVAPILMVFAFSGARQSITSINTPVLLGMGRSGVQLRFSVIASVVQVAAIAVGLHWGTLGVAIGYTVAGVALTPYIALLQRRYAGVRIRDAVLAFLPSLHATAWAVVAYLGLSLLALQPGLTLLLGAITGALVYGLVLGGLHKSYCRTVCVDVRSVIARR